MFTMNRRRFLSAVTASTAFALTRGSWAAAVKPHLVIQAEKVIAQVPADFMGLSYESSQLAHPAFFSAANAGLSSFMKTLGSDGVLRIGGNMSEFTVWNPDGSMENEGDNYVVEGPDPGKRIERSFTITPRAITNLNAFLEATNWKLIYGLNLARSTPEAAADEAAFVNNACGSRLLALQFGNEPDLFRHNGTPPKTWTYTEFISKWKQFEEAVHGRAPNAPLAGPDTSYSINWIDGFARDANQQAHLLTAHYYAEGPPTDPRMTIDYLLTQQKAFKNEVLNAINAARKAGLPYRMSEGNSCYNAGKKGVSDTFASALWAGDFIAQIASLGASGINLHGGGNGLYTPIAGSQKDGFCARPIYYGMLMARSLAGSAILESELDTAGLNVTAYAMKKNENLIALVFNKSNQATSISIPVCHGLRKTASLLRLTAPAIDATSGVTFGGSSVKADGSWAPSSIEKLRAVSGTFEVTLPAYGAAHITFA
jgi:hypothetical protein